MEPVQEMPEWKFWGMMFCLLIAMCVILTLVMTGMIYFDDKYNQNPGIFVTARYTNLTNVGISFSETGIYSVDHFPKVAEKIDFVEIYIDNNLTDIIHGTILTNKKEYSYTVDSNRHYVNVQIHYKNGRVQKRDFFNSNLERGY
jgi:hypothetical protein